MIPIVTNDEYISAGNIVTVMDNSLSYNESRGILEGKSYLVIRHVDKDGDPFHGTTLYKSDVLDFDNPNSMVKNYRTWLRTANSLPGCLVYNNFGQGFKNLIEKTMSDIYVYGHKFTDIEAIVDSLLGALSTVELGKATIDFMSVDGATVAVVYLDNGVVYRYGQTPDGDWDVLDPM